MDGLLDQDLFSMIALRARGRIQGVRPGTHGGEGEGQGGPFTSLVSLLNHPDPRRIDVRSSLADPSETIWVRRYRPAVAARIIVLLDASGSMAAQGRGDRWAMARCLAVGLARAVSRSQDAFGLLVGGGNRASAPLWPPARRRGLAEEVDAALAEVTPEGKGWGGFLDAAERVPVSRSIVLLLSDFAAPMAEVERLLDRLAGHDLHPFVLRDSGLETPPSRFGLLPLEDLEGGGRRMVLMRPALALRWREAAEARRRRLDGCFVARGLSPVEIVDQIDVDHLFEALSGYGGT
ncbi:hypothetical protein [Rhodospirillum sp. A1_3_36]|uniref:DUF58 domain-containing protein n=1 Tax=Rhodospirillum sp. A1_3_36 TaxID=3391666 RepID=UPI0039A4A5DE